MTTILPSAYLAPVQYYTKLCGGEARIIEDRGEHFQKQTIRNRCRILGPQGIETLVVPVSHTGGATRTPMRDIRISTHEPAWQRRHWHALKTAYQATPYFIYYADELASLYEQPFRYLCDWNDALDRLVRGFLGITAEKTVSPHHITPAPGDTDLRQALNPKRPQPDPAFRPQPYWQLGARQGAFVPNLSIADLLFNTGPEARLILLRSIPT